MTRNRTRRRTRPNPNPNPNQRRWPRRVASRRTTDRPRQQRTPPPPSRLPAAGGHFAFVCSSPRALRRPDGEETPYPSAGGGGFGGAGRDGSEGGIWNSQPPVPSPPRPPSPYSAARKAAGKSPSLLNRRYSAIRRRTRIGLDWVTAGG